MMNEANVARALLDVFGDAVVGASAISFGFVLVLLIVSAFRRSLP